MVLQQTPSKLNWLQPGKKEVVLVGNYVVDEASQLHTGFGGSSKLDMEQVKFLPDLQPYQ